MEGVGRGIVRRAIVSRSIVNRDTDTKAEKL
jgi:hypothetical protein